MKCRTYWDALWTCFSNGRTRVEVWYGNFKYQEENLRSYRNNNVQTTRTGGVNSFISVNTKTFLFWTCLTHNSSPTRVFLFVERARILLNKIDEIWSLARDKNLSNCQIVNKWRGRSQNVFQKYDYLKLVCWSYLYFKYLSSYVGLSRC